MNFWNSLFDGTNAWSGGVAHSMLILALVIALGKLLGKYKIKGISLGVTWVLFTGILFSHFKMTLDSNLLHFLKEFGLILFVYSIGLQVGPGFFSSFKAGGVKLNLLAVLVCILGAGTAIGIHFITGTEMTTMTGIMSGAVTNTPGLGAAQTAYSDMHGGNSPDIALGYAVAYPLGVVGAILSFIIIRKLFYRKGTLSATAIREVGTDISEEKKEAETSIISKHSEAAKTSFISRKILISKRSLNGKRLDELKFEEILGASIIRIRRAGLDLRATPEFRLQYGDLVTVVGSSESVASVEKVLGNSLKRLDEPNLIPIFLGIALGVIFGSLPISFPGMPQAVKLGLAGGPLIISILLSSFGPRLKVITYTTTSANLMIREIGICIFLACVGLEAGSGFVDTIVNKGGYIWIAYGALITLIPLLVCGLIGRYCMKLNYLTLIGVLSGASTNPPALAYSNEVDRNSDEAAVGYATVYPLTMFLRVLIAQMMILFLC
ncbi:MAG: TrkA C-terminal domain-containing protein [Bacteroidales bacterium]|nr:TrkA C-terminal domain-containing protein [Bacteroidales bacterium]